MAAKEATATATKEEAAAAEATPGGGGLKAWLPLGLNLLLMPVLAWAMTSFVLIPKVQKSLGGSAPLEEAAAPADAHGGGHGAPASHGKEAGGGKAKMTAPLSGKVLVNVAGTMGTRYLLANLTLVGTHPELKSLVEKNDPQLRDAAASTLASKTIADLEKPGARNLIRTELISVFNNILGNNMVSEIYLTEFAIQ